MGEETPRQTIDERRPREAFLNQDRIVSKRRIELAQPVRHSRLPRHALELILKHLRRDRSLPEPFQGKALLEVGADAILQNLSRHRPLERARGPDLVGIVDALDGRLRTNSLF